MATTTTTTVRLISNYTDDFPLCCFNISVSPLPCPPPPPIPILPDPDTTPNPIHLDSKSKSFLRNHAVLALTLLACIFVFSCLTTAVLVFFYRRSQRRRALASLVDAPLFASDPAAPAPGAGPGVDPGDDDPIHHVWYIRTVGLDEATIESIAVTQYKAGTGLLGSADCSVCLGDFQDGDLVRLLPKCGHAFHVPCIDTWLRAHVNCPVCRSDVVDTTVPVADGESTEVTSEASNRDTEETASETRENVGVSLDVQSREREGNEHEDEVFDEIPLSDSSSSGSSVLTLQTDSAEREPSREPVRHRSASVDSPFLIPSVIITIPETGISDQVLKDAIFGEEQIGKEKERISNMSKAGSTHMGPLEMVRSLSSSGSSGRSFFFSRSGRSRSSVLPL